jgi:hypothetical protein
LIIFKVISRLPLAALDPLDRQFSLRAPDGED